MDALMLKQWQSDQDQDQGSRKIEQGFPAPSQGHLRSVSLDASGVLRSWEDGSWASEPFEDPDPYIRPLNEEEVRRLAVLIVRMLKLRHQDPWDRSCQSSGARTPRRKNNA